MCRPGGNKAGLERTRELVGKALSEGLLINVTSEKIIRLLPPLIFSDDDARELVARTAPLIKDFLAA